MSPDSHTSSTGTIETHNSDFSDVRFFIAMKGRSFDVFWIATFVFLWEHEFIGGAPSIGVGGGDAYLNWTITNSSYDKVRYIMKPAGKGPLMVFDKNSLIPTIIVDNRTRFTGDLLHRIVSFTLSNVSLSDAGNYTFVYQESVTQIFGSQVLVVAETPDTPGIISLSLSAMAGREYKLNCSTVSGSVPLDHNLPMYSDWMKNGININKESRYSVSGTILTISNLDKKDNGSMITCRAFEDQRKISAESSDFILNVLYGPDSVQITPPDELTVSEGGNISITCTGECNPPCSFYYWMKDYLPAIVGHSQSYLIPAVKRNHAGVYTCTVSNTNISKNATAQIRVRVNYGPDTGKITLSPNQTSYEPVESTQLSINCSADCYPDCQYRWTGPGVGNYGSTGMLYVPEVKRDQSGTFTCTATNPAINDTSATASISVAVLYGPDAGSITLFPNKTSYEQAENSSLSVNCSAVCSRNCQYRWTGPGGDNFGNTSVLSIPQMMRNHTGVFTCTVTNPGITSKSATAAINLTVFYGPDTPLHLQPDRTSYRIVEGATIPDISCSSNCYPSCEFIWTGPILSSNGVISLGSVNRSEKGNYTCSGKNPRTQAKIDSSMVTVIVMYGPDTPVLTPSMIEYTLNESNILPNISCSTHCFPDCTTYWHKEQLKVPGIPADMLSLGDVYRNDSGTYTCRSQNIESNITGENAIRLVVQYPPTISIESNNGSFTDTGLMINCTAHGIPARYSYSLIHSSLFSAIKIRQLIDIDPVSTGVFVHRFTNPSFMDTGVYTCIVSNGILDYKDDSLDKNVSETVWIRGPPNVTSSEKDFYAEKGHPGRLVIEFYNSLLNATVTWKKQRNQTLEKLETSDKYNISVASTNVTVKFYSVFLQQPGFIATLEIQNVTEQDFSSEEDLSSYQVLLQNYAGNSSELTLNLRPRGRPDIPKDVHIVPNSITTRSVGIEWMSGFHGGSDQTFVIEYKMQKDESWTNYSHDVFGGMRQKKYFNITIEDLQQNTLYFFQLYAWNLFNRSEYSTIINVTTYAESINQPVTVNSADGVIIGVAVGAVIFLAVTISIVAIILYRRRSVRKPHSNGTPLELDERSDEINNRESGLVDNPLYETTVAEYAAVMKHPKKKDNSNLYAQVDKKQKKGKKGAANGKHGETSRGDIYENVNLGGKNKNGDIEHDDSRQTKTENSDENVYENPGAVASKGPLVNKDGLFYADLMLDQPTTRNGKVVIRGIENRTEYAEIAYGKRGEPLPDSAEENVDGVFYGAELAPQALKVKS